MLSERLLCKLLPPVLAVHVFAFGMLFGAEPSEQREATAATEDNLKQRFLTEAPAGWRTLSGVILHSRGRVHLTATKPELNPEVGYQLDVEYMLNGENRRRVVFQNLKSHSMTVGCRNPSQTFWLGGVPADQGMYRIETLRREDDSMGWTNYRQADDHAWVIVPLLYSPFAIIDHELTEIVSSTDFVLQSLQPSSTQVGQIDVTFTFRTDDARLWEAALTVDPSNSWAVTRCEVEFQHHRVEGAVLWHRSEIEYAPDQYASLVRLPVRVIQDGGTTEERDAGEFGRFEIVLQDFSHEDVPEEAFTLAAFGLTEVGEESNWSRWLILLINLGLILVAMGYWMHRRQARRNSPPMTATP